MTDAALATGLLAAAVTTLVLDVRQTPSYRRVDLLAYTLTVAGCLPFYFRRRAPLAVLLTGTVPVVVLIHLGYSTKVLGAGLLVSAYTVAAWRSRQEVAVAATAVASVLLVVTVLRPDYLAPSGVVSNVMLFAAMFALGDGMRARRAHGAALRERAVLAERSRAAEARRAVLAERLRIAQDLHDVVAHSLGVIALQAGVGTHVIDRQPADAKQSLKVISEISRSTLGEIRGILGMLRTTDAGGSSDVDAPSYAPRLGLADVDRLATQLAAGGMPVRVTVEGERNGLPRGVDVTAYRIVQEALTNVSKHAGGAHAEVVIRYRPEEATLSVTDDGGRTGSCATAGGFGLIGMRERVAAFGGSLTAGPRPSGGYRVEARLPYRTGR